MLSYANNVNCGTATVTISGKGNYTGKVEETFQITQKIPEKDVDYKVALPADRYMTASLVGRLCGRKQVLARSQFGTTTARLCRFMPELTTWRSGLHQVKIFLQLNG